jgi:Ca2+-binding EF-hand superfamily protein
MKTLLKGTLLVGLATVGVATAAWALQAQHGFNPASLDADRDGVISTTELDAHANLLFARTDRDNDGSLSADELQVLHAMLPGGGAAMAHAPGHTPAPVNRQAFREALRDHATRMDADRNGRLTVAELGTAMHGGQAH